MINIKQKHNKLAIITGASQGIGKALAFGLAEDGYDLALIARSEKHLETIAKKIEAKTGRDVFVYPLDIANFNGIKTIIANILEIYGSIDVLCNNAGVYKSGTLELSLADYQYLLDVNFKGALAFMQAVLPIMKKKKKGHIFNIASTAGKIGWAGMGGYVASKFALVGLTESIFHEYSRCGIRITAICPGYVNTKMARNAGAELPAARMIQVEDILETVRWLLKLSSATCVKEIFLECEEFA